MAHAVSFALFKPLNPGEEAELCTLIHASRSGDSAALNQLLSSCVQPIRVVARRIIQDPDELSDVVQHVCLKLISALDSFDEERRFSTWLYRITINCAIDHARKLRREAHLSLEIAESVESPEAYGPEHATLCHEREYYLRAAAAHLPLKQRRLLLRHELDGVTTAELAKESGQPISAIRWHLLEGRRKLRKELRRTLRPATLRSLLNE